MNAGKIQRLERLYEHAQDKVRDLDRLLALAKGRSPIHPAVLDHFGAGLFPAQAALVDVFLALYHDWLVEHVSQAGYLEVVDLLHVLSDLNKFYDALCEAD